MTKKALRNIMVCFCVFIFTIIVAYIASMYSYNLTLEKASEVIGTSAPDHATLKPLKDDDLIAVNHYVARYNGEYLAIYAATNDNEEFLYTLDARIEDISKEELEELIHGIILPDKQALASFEEDFTS